METVNTNMDISLLLGSVWGHLVRPTISIKYRTQAKLILRNQFYIEPMFYSNSFLDKYNIILFKPAYKQK